jgi:hypothetical protein
VGPGTEFASEQNELFLVFFSIIFFSNIVKWLKRMHRWRKNKKNLKITRPPWLAVCQGEI